MLALLEEFCQANAISEDDMFNIRLVLDEAVINVIVHGYEDTTGPPVNVSLALHHDVLTIHIDDDGSPITRWTPRRRASICLSRSGDIGGLGVHIMKTLARQRRVPPRPRTQPSDHRDDDRA